MSISELVYVIVVISVLLCYGDLHGLEACRNHAVLDTSILYFITKYREKVSRNKMHAVRIRIVRVYDIRYVR